MTLLGRRSENHGFGRSLLDLDRRRPDAVAGGSLKVEPVSCGSSQDIIGDVHGHADRLEALLHELGYENRHGTWRHPSRTAIFVGDFVDRGPGQLRTLELVRAMMDAGSARATMPDCARREYRTIAEPEAGGRATQ